MTSDRPALVAADGTRIAWPLPLIPYALERMAHDLSVPNKSEAAAFLRDRAGALAAGAAPGDYITAAHLLAIADCIESKRRWRSGPADWQRRTAIGVLAAASRLRAPGETVEDTVLELAKRNAAALGFDGADGVENLRRAILDSRNRKLGGEISGSN